MSESAPDFDVNEAAANAKKLALSTNSAPSAQSWQNPNYFDFYAQIPPPNFYQSSQLGGGGMNFMTGANSNFAPSPIPQLSMTPRSPRPHPPRLYQYRPPAAFYNNYSHPSANFLPGNQQRPTWNDNTSNGEVVERVARNPENHGPKPIRFSLNSAGKKHVFNKPNNFTGGGGFSNVNTSGGGYGNKTSRFGPPITPLEGTIKVTPDPYTSQISNHVENAETHSVPNVDTSKPSYGITNGSNWASTSSPQTSTGPAPGLSKGKNSADDDLSFSACINSDNWSDSLKKYAERWFTIVLSSGCNVIDKAQDLLRQKLEEAYRAGNFTTKDWTLEPLPVLPSTSAPTVKNVFNLGPIPGTVKGTPLKPDVFSSGGRGRGRGGTRGRTSPVRAEGFKNRQGRPKGIRGRNRFRSRSTSRSWSRSRSSSPSSSEGKSKKRKRSNSGNTKYNKKAAKENKYGKKEKGKISKKSNSKDKKKSDAHIYSEFGSVGGCVSDSVNEARLNARAARFAKDESKNSSPKSSMKSRLGGFVNNSNLLGSNSMVKWTIDTNPSTFNNDHKGFDMNTKIVGACTNLEKMYLRLTAAPDPSSIRPVHILKESLKMVREKWKRKDDYRYTCDQLKAIRQDLTVQRVREPFTVLVYETHARIALEKGDHEEFNQCQSQLVQLYQTLPNARENQLEFTAYRILYYIFTTSTLDLGTIQRSLNDTEIKDECIAHALKLLSAWQMGNYNLFFKLHKVAPKMSGYLIDWFVNRERKNALRKILKAYRPTMTKSFLLDQLDLTDEGWKKFLKSNNLESAIFYSDAPANTKIKGKETQAAVIAVLGS